MNPAVALTLFSTLTLFLAVNIPIALSLGLSSLVTIALFRLVSFQMIPELMFSAVNSWTLLAVPFFILAGNILGKTEISRRLVRLADALLGRVPGGLGITAVAASIFFAGISGSGPADVAALGAFLIPAMSRAGYDKDFAAALMAAGGGIGIIMPPSIVLGLFMDAISVFYLLVPIFLPMIRTIGVDPVHFGIILTVNLAIGQITPPVGVNLLVASTLSGSSIRRISRAALPLIAAESVVLLLVTYFPGLCLWLPGLMK